MPGVRGEGRLTADETYLMAVREQTPPLHRLPRWLVGGAQLFVLATLTSVCVTWSLVSLRQPDWLTPRQNLVAPMGDSIDLECFGAHRRVWRPWPRPQKADQGPTPPPTAVVIEDTYGWPAPFLQCQWLSHRPMDFDTGYLDIELGLHGGLRLPPASNHRYHTLGAPALALPLLPVAGGAAINLLVWALPWVALAALASIVAYRRRTQRWNSGLCADCLYPRPASAGSACPECGAAPQRPRLRMLSISQGWFGTAALALMVGAAALLANARPYRLSSEVPPLHLAVRDGDRDRLASLIESGTSVEASWTRNTGLVVPMTPLMWASRLGNTSAMEQLIAAGADVDAVDRRDNTAAFYALQAPTGTPFQLLLDRGADVRATDMQGSTLLHIAAFESQPGAIRRLLAAGLGVNARNLPDEPPLFYAIIRPDVPTVRALLDAGADPNAISRDGVSMLVRAAMWADAEVVQLLLAAGADPNAQDSGYTALCCAANVNNPNALPVLTVLLEAGADPDAKGPNGETIEELMVMSSRPPSTPGTTWTIGPSAPSPPHPVVEKAHGLLERYRARR